MRAGVNSGQVVFGLLGSSFKQEWLAIGKTTNLAARLQSKGEIGEVVTLPEIAEQVGLSVRTVDNHLTRVYRKLGIAGRDELAEALADLS